MSFSGGGNPSKYALGENETRTGKQRVTENIRTDWFFEGDITIMPRGKSLRTDRRRGMKKKYKYFLIGVLSTMFLFVLKTIIITQSLETVKSIIKTIR